VLVPGVAVLLGEGEDTDGERGDEASTVARFDVSQDPLGNSNRKV
jgi:hypothetical protein